MAMNTHDIQTNRAETLLSVTANTTGNSFKKSSRVVTFQVTGVGGGTVIIEASNNDSDWVQVLSTSAVGGWIFDEPYIYIRARNTGYTSGTAEVLMGR